MMIKMLRLDQEIEVNQVNLLKSKMEIERKKNREKYINKMY